MDSLDIDTTNLIIKQIPVLERLQIYKVLNIPRPTQFQVSSELITSKNFRGNKGLIMLASETGDYEPCVQAILMLTRIHAPHWDDDLLSSNEDEVREKLDDIDDEDGRRHAVYDKLYWFDEWFNEMELSEKDEK